MRSEATINPHPHAPARHDLTCTSLPFASESRRRGILNGRPPVRERAIRQPRGGDSAWEDGGSAVLQVGGTVLEATTRTQVSSSLMNHPQHRAP